VDGKATLIIGHVLAPAGDESVALRGAILDAPLGPGQYDPSTDGLEFAITADGLVFGLGAPASARPPSSHPSGRPRRRPTGRLRA